MKLIDLRDEFKILIPYLPKQEQELIPDSYNLSPGSFLDSVLSAVKSYLKNNSCSFPLSYILGRSLFFTGRFQQLKEFMHLCDDIVFHLWVRIATRYEPELEYNILQVFLDDNSEGIGLLYHSLIHILQSNFIYRTAKLSDIKIHSLFQNEQFELIPHPFDKLIYADLAYGIFLSLYYKYLLGETINLQQHMEDGLRYLGLSNYKPIVARYMELKGLLLFDQGYYSQAYKHFEESAQISSQSDDEIQLLFNRIRLSKFYLLENRYFLGKQYIDTLLQTEHFIFSLQSVRNYLTFTKIMMLIKENNYTQAKEEINTYLSSLFKEDSHEITIRDAFQLLQLLQALNFEIGVQLVKEKFYNITFYPKNVLKLVIDAIDSKLSANYLMSLRNTQRAIELLSQINDDYLVLLLYAERLSLTLKIQIMNWNFHDEVFACIQDIYTFINNSPLGQLGTQFKDNLERIVPSLHDPQELTYAQCHKLLQFIDTCHRNFWLLTSNNQPKQRESKLLYLAIVDDHGDVFADTGGSEDIMLVNNTLRQFLETEEHIQTTNMNVDIGKFQIFSILLPAKPGYRLIAVAREIDNKTIESLETVSKTIDAELLTIENKATVSKLLHTLLEL